MGSRASSYSKQKLRRFAFLVSTAFIILFGVLPFVRHPSGGINIVIFTIGLTLPILSLVRPYSLSTPYLYWLKVGDFLASVNSKLILGAFFFLVITPLAILAKSFKSVLTLRKSSNSARGSFRLAPASQISSFSDQH